MNLQRWLKNIQARIDNGTLDGGKAVGIFNRRGEAETPVIMSVFNRKTGIQTRHVVLAPGDE